MQDLCAKLSDPSLDVREAAVASLGQIASNEAIASLLRALGAPSSDLTVPALRALRDALRERPGGLSVVALLQAETDTDWTRAIVTAVAPLLAHANLEVVREAARLLGLTPDPAARTALIDLLHATRHDPVALAAAAALGRQGDVLAVYEIIPRMRASRSNAAEKAFAVAAGDLLGTPGGFYEMLTKEEQTHNSALSGLVGRLTASSQRLDADRNSRFLAEMGQALAGIEDRYEARDLPACAAAVLRIARLFAQHRYQLAEDLELFRFLPELEQRDPRFAAGAWFISLLHGAFARADAPPALRPVRSLVEIQLAVYILSSWADGLHGAPSPQPRKP